MKQAEGDEERVRVWRRLAEVDPGLYKRLAAIAAGVVAAHDGAEVSSSGDLHAALLAQAYGRDYQA